MRTDSAHSQKNDTGGTAGPQPKITPEDSSTAESEIDAETPKTPVDTDTDTAVAKDEKKLYTPEYAIDPATTAVDAVASPYAENALAVPLVVRMCEHENFGGHCVYAAFDLVAKGNQAAILPKVLDNNVSSIRVWYGPNYGNDGCVAKFYTNPKGTGDVAAQLDPDKYGSLKKLVNVDDSPAGNLNNKIRSVRFAKKGSFEPCTYLPNWTGISKIGNIDAWLSSIELVAELHTHPEGGKNQKNRTSHVLLSTPELSKVSMNDDVDAVRIWKGPHFKSASDYKCMMTFYPDEDYKGYFLDWREIFPKDTTSQAWTFDKSDSNKASSLKITCGSPPSPPPPSPPAATSQDYLFDVMLYADANYEGNNFRTFTEQVAGAGQAILPGYIDGLASSLYISPWFGYVQGCLVHFYDNPQATGNPILVLGPEDGGNYPNLKDVFNLETYQKVNVDDKIRSFRFLYKDGTPCL